MTDARQETIDSPVHRVAWDERDTLRAVLREHPVVHLRTGGLSPAEHLRFAAGFGTVVPPIRDYFGHPEQPEIMLFGNVRDDEGRERSGNAIGLGWHSDRAGRPGAPELSFLYGDVIPPSGGGDTLFSSLYRVYDDLDEDTRAAWRSLEIVHRSPAAYFANRPAEENLQPIVQRHPESGRRLVFSSPATASAVVGLDPEASDAVLERLAEALEPPHAVHRWQPGDVLVWDNRAVVHRATEFDHSELRRLWRVSIRLDEAAG